MESKCRASDSRNLVETGRIAFVLIDGLADIHIPALASLTPLEAANTSAMDAIAGTKFERWALSLTTSRNFTVVFVYSCWLERSS